MPDLSNTNFELQSDLALIVLQRPISASHTGADKYLSAFVDQIKASGFRVDILVYPMSTFGDVPARKVNKLYDDISNRIHWRKTARISDNYISTSPTVYFRFISRVFQEIQGRITGTRVKKDWRASLTPPQGEVEAVTKHINSLRPSLVVAEYSTLGPSLAGLDPAIVKAIFLHDLFSMRAEAMKKHDLPLDFKERSREEEAQLCAPADVLFYASQQEREIFEAMLPDRTHLWFAPRVGPAEPAPASGHPNAMFMGVYHSGNLDALDFLLSEIWPRVIELNPEARLSIVGEIGEHLTEEQKRLQGIEILGIVDSLASVAGPDTVGVAPTRVASGISIKVIDYMRLGMAVVASSVAVEGYGSLLDDVVIKAEDANVFAEELARVLGSTTQRHALAEKSLSEGLPRIDNTPVDALLRNVRAGAFKAG